MHAYLVRVNCALVNKLEGSVDDKPKNRCCQLLVAFFRVLLYYMIIIEQVSKLTRCLSY